MSLPAKVPSHIPLFRHVGTWLGLFMAVYILFNAGRALYNPVGFASYYGTPLSVPTEVNFVYVYAIRSLLLGVLGGWLIATRRIDALSILAFSAVVMALGDALLTQQAGAAAVTVIRHLGIAGFLVVTGVLLQRVARSGTPA